MAIMLRKIEWRRWYKDKEMFSWLGEGEIPADPLTDLKTTQNNLSVFYIKEDHSNLNDIIAAMAATRDYAANFDYLLFDEQICSELSIEIKDTKGATPNEEVNKWHRDLMELSADKLLNLSKLFYEKGKTKRMQEKEVTTKIASASLVGKIPIVFLEQKKPHLYQKVIKTQLRKTSSSS